MWDIKPAKYGVNGVVAEYYLNHVGYKACISRLRWISCGPVYYLNHVGYKGCLTAFIFLPFFPYYLNHVGYKGFCPSRYHLFPSPYYLNHVGYKVGSLIPKFHRLL